MKRLTTLCIGAAFAMLGATVPAQAEWTMGAGYLHLSDDDVDLGALAASLGYRFDLSPGVVFVPEIRGGFGVKDEEVGAIELDVDSFFAFSPRLQLESDTGLYAFVTASYAYLEVGAEADFGQGTINLSEDDWDFGGGLGAGYMFTDQVGLEASYENFSGTDIFGLNLRINF